MCGKSERVHEEIFGDSSSTLSYDVQLPDGTLPGSAPALAYSSGG